MKVRIARDEIYPVYFFEDEQLHKHSIEVSQDLIDRAKATWDAWDAVQDEIGAIYDEDREK